MIRRMEAQGLVTIETGSIRLTDDGMGLAESVVRRHRLADVQPRVHDAIDAPGRVRRP